MGTNIFNQPRDLRHSYVKRYKLAPKSSVGLQDSDKLIFIWQSLIKN